MDEYYYDNPYGGKPPCDVSAVAIPQPLSIRSIIYTLAKKDETDIIEKIQTFDQKKRSKYINCIEENNLQETDSKIAFILDTLQKASNSTN